MSQAYAFTGAANPVAHLAASIAALVGWRRAGLALALNNVLDGMADGSSNLDLNDFAVGYNLGALIEPRPGTRIGMTYRSRLQFDFSGSAQMSNVGPTLQALGFAGDSAHGVSPFGARGAMAADVEPVHEQTGSEEGQRVEGDAHRR